MSSEHSIIDSFTLFTTSTDKIKNNSPILSISSMEHINDKLTKLHNKITQNQQSTLMQFGGNNKVDSTTSSSTSDSTSYSTSDSTTSDTTTTKSTTTKSKPSTSTTKTYPTITDTSSTNNFASIIDTPNNNKSTLSSSDTLTSSSYTETSTYYSTTTKNKTNKMPINSSIDTYLKSIGDKKNKKK